MEPNTKANVKRVSNLIMWLFYQTAFMINFFLVTWRHNPEAWNLLRFWMWATVVFEVVMILVWIIVSKQATKSIEDYFGELHVYRLLQNAGVALNIFVVLILAADAHFFYGGLWLVHMFLNIILSPGKEDYK